MYDAGRLNVPLLLLSPFCLNITDEGAAAH